MSEGGIAIAGFIGPLALGTAEALRRRGCQVAILPSPQDPSLLAAARPGRLILFPFAPSLAKREQVKNGDGLAYIGRVLDWARDAGIERVVLRSHAVAYGISMKNPGLLEEGRVTLLPKTSLERRWLEAESVLFDHPGAGIKDSDGGFSAAAVRMASILAPEEGDLITRMISGRMAAPMAGYDPQLQLMSLADAAECLACAALSSSQGIFNGSPSGTVPAKAALKAAVPVRIPVNGVVQKPIRSLLWKAGLADFPGEVMDRIKYNWTVANDRAKREFGFSPAETSSQALKAYLSQIGRGRAHRIKDEYDEFGLDPEYLQRLKWWFTFLSKIYWRAEVEGMDNVPATGPALLVANHRGFMPFDGVVHRTLILDSKKRHIRILVIPSLFKFPFLSDFLVKQGGVVASQENTRKLFRRKELVGIFPEGIEGAFRMYKGAYKLGDMHRNAFARLAIEHRVPIIPSATIGHVEIFPILAKVRSSFIVRVAGWPFLPITPTFPLLPVPLPTKWHIRYLEPIPVDGYSPEDAGNPKAVNDLARVVCEVMQRNIDEMLCRRKHVFFGNIFNNGRGISRTKSVDATG